MKELRDLMIVFTFIFLTTSCASNDSEKKIKQTTEELNNVEKSLNYWGKVAMSEPVFIENKGQFKVTFNGDTSNYVQAARNSISGASRSALETSLYLGLALQGQVTPPISLGSSPSSISTNGSGGGSLPNQAGSALNSFTPLLGLGSAAPAIDERQAVAKGINDKIAEQLLNFMANPNINSNQQQIVFGVMQITCQPGQKTREGYLADLNVSLGYGRLADSNSPLNNVNDGIEKSDLLYPGIFAVLPLVDSRNVELQNSDRSQIELASALSMALAAKGANAAATSLSDYVKRQESDMETRNSLPVVTSYTDGTTFGFQIYPSFQAIQKPSKAKSAGDVLEPVTFPAVVAIIINKSDYYDATNHDQIKTNYQSKTPWNYLVTESETRWVPLKAPYFVNTSHFDGLLMDNFSLWDSSLFDRVRRGRLIDGARQRLTTLATNEAVYQQYQQLKIALDSLEETALGMVVERPLPDNLFSDNNASKPSITDVFPHAVWRDTNTTFSIIIKGIANDEVTGVNLAGISYKTNEFYRYPDGTNGIVLNVTLPSVFYNTASASNAVEFVVLSNKQPPISRIFNMQLQGKVAPEATAIVSRDTSGKVAGLDIKPGKNLSEQQILDAIKDILLKSEPSPKTVNIVK